MNCVERVKQLCKERRIPISKLEKDLGFANGYIGQLKKGTLPAERALKIAKYFDVSLKDIISEEEVSEMPIRPVRKYYHMTEQPQVDFHLTQPVNREKALEDWGLTEGNAPRGAMELYAKYLLSDQQTRNIIDSLLDGVQINYSYKSQPDLTGSTIEFNIKKGSDQA